MDYRDVEQSFITAMCHSTANAKEIEHMKFDNATEVLKVLQVMECRNCNELHLFNLPQANKALRQCGHRKSWSADFQNYIDNLVPIAVHEQFAELLSHTHIWKMINTIVDCFVQATTEFEQMICAKNSKKAPKGKLIHISCEKHKTFHSFNQNMLVDEFLNRKKLNPGQIYQSIMRYPNITDAQRKLVLGMFKSIYADMYGTRFSRSGSTPKLLFYPTLSIIDLMHCYQHRLDNLERVDKLVREGWSPEAHAQIMSYENTDEEAFYTLKVSTATQLPPVLYANELTEEEMLYWIGCFRKVPYKTEWEASRHTGSEKVAYLCNYDSEHYHIGGQYSEETKTHGSTHRESMNAIWHRKPQKSNIYAMQLLLN